MTEELKPDYASKHTNERFTVVFPKGLNNEQKQIYLLERILGEIRDFKTDWYQMHYGKAKE